MIKAPDNIALVTLPRSGSTSLLFKLRRCMETDHGEDQVSRLGEAGTAAGLLGLRHYAIQKILKENDYADPVKFNHWQIEDGKFFMAKETGDPRGEAQNRVDLLLSNWSNHVVIKHIISQDNETITDLNEALYNSDRCKFHNVFLWRQDLRGMICSRFVSEQTRRNSKLADSWMGHSSHGIYEWNGQPIGNPKKTRYNDGFISFTRSMIVNYIKTGHMLPKDRTFMVETKNIDSLVDIEWNDGCKLSGLDQWQTDRTESNKYVYTYDTSKQLKTYDMIHPTLLDMIDSLADEIERDYEWSRLDERMDIPWLR